MDRPRVGALQAVRGRMRVVGGTTKSREEDEGKTDILVCPIKRMVIGSLQKLTGWYFSKRNDSFSGILCNRDLLMVFFRNDDLSML